MFCPECGHDNLETSDFCGECGASLAGAKVVLQQGGGAGGSDHCPHNLNCGTAAATCGGSGTCLPAAPTAVGHLSASGPNRRSNTESCSAATRCPTNRRLPAAARPGPLRLPPL